MSADPDRALLAAALAFASAAAAGSAAAIRYDLPGHTVALASRCRSQPGYWPAGEPALPHPSRCPLRRSLRRQGPGAPSHAL
jgi:hypothetical protein